MNFLKKWRKKNKIKKSCPQYVTQWRDIQLRWINLRNYWYLLYMPYLNNSIIYDYLGYLWTRNFKQNWHVSLFMHLSFLFLYHNPFSIGPPGITLKGAVENLYFYALLALTYTNCFKNHCICTFKYYFCKKKTYIVFTFTLTIGSGGCKSLVH